MANSATKTPSYAALKGMVREVKKIFEAGEQTKSAQAEKALLLCDTAIAGLKAYGANCWERSDANYYRGLLGLKLWKDPKGPSARKTQESFIYLKEAIRGYEFNGYDDMHYSALQHALKCHNLGKTALDLGYSADAADLCAKARSIFAKHVESNTQIAPAIRYFFFASFSNALADVLETGGNLVEAKKLYGEVLKRNAADAIDHAQSLKELSHACKKMRKILAIEREIDNRRGR